MAYIGELAALLTSLCWSFSAIGFTKSSQQVGSQITNRVRVLLAMLMLVLIDTALYGQPIPLYAGASRWVWLGVSGVIGLSLGDAFLFQAYHEIGRVSACCCSAWPRSSARPSPGSSSARRSTCCRSPASLSRWGYHLGGPGPPAGRRRKCPQGDRARHPVRDAGRPRAGNRPGLLPARDDGGFSPFAGTLIRMLAAVVTLWIVAAFQRQAVPLSTPSPAARGYSAGWPSGHCSDRLSASRRRCWQSSTPGLAWPAR